MQQITLPAPIDRWASSFMVGSSAIVAGGLVAAINAAAPSEKGAWVAAYLVLVVGIAQIVLGLGQAWLAAHPPATRIIAAEVAMYNLGNAAVIGGTLTDRTRLVDLGGAMLVVSLASYLWATRRAPTRRILVAYWLLIALVLVSIPVGLVLARITE